MRLTPLHGGALHGIEWALSLVLILGPLLALAVTIALVRRRDAREAGDAAHSNPTFEV